MGGGFQAFGKACVLTAAALVALARTTGAAVLDYTSSVADYEPRLVRPMGSQPGQDFAIDTNYDTPSDAVELRVGGQARFKFTGAFFFPLPTFTPGQTVSSANLRFTQRPDANAAAPQFDLDLRVLGITSDISETYDPDATGKAPTINPALGPELYNETNEDTRDGIGTSLPRLLLQDDFVTGDQGIPTGGATVVRETGDMADLLLVNYLNQLIAQGVPAGSHLIVALNPDATPDDTQTNRLIFASANNATAADRPALQLEVVPEPSTLGVLGIAVAGLLARRRRSA
jgi:hypothetical protein